MEKPVDTTIEVSFDGKKYKSVKVPHGFNMEAQWQKFCEVHHFISDKKGAFPHSFFGDLMKLGCSETAIGSTKIDLKIP